MSINNPFYLKNSDFSVSIIRAELLRMAKDRDKNGDPGEIGTELDLPDENEYSEAAKPSSNMSFGMVDLGGGEAAREKLPPPEEVQKPSAKPKPQLPPKPPAQAKFMQEAQAAQPSTPPPSTPAPASKPPPASTPPPGASSPAPYAIRSQRTTPSGGLPMAPAKRLREEEPQTTQVRTAGLSRTIKIALILILALVLIALGVFLYLRWQKGVEAERQAELDRLNQQSRDSLMDDRFKKD
jgi:hypothetical protein